MHCPMLVVGDQVEASLAPFSTDIPGNYHGEWDYWVVGGAFEGGLRLKNGETANVARKADLDLEATEPTEFVVNVGMQAVFDRDPAERQRKWHLYLDDLPDDTQLTLVDAHV